MPHPDADQFDRSLDAVGQAPFFYGRLQIDQDRPVSLGHMTAVPQVACCSMRFQVLDWVRTKVLTISSASF
jgi:hypothetical protein